jgi:hypothetical protein
MQEWGAWRYTGTKVKRAALSEWNAEPWDSIVTELNIGRFHKNRRGRLLRCCFEALSGIPGTDGRRPEYKTAGRNQHGVITQDEKRHAGQEGPTKKEAPDQREAGEALRGCGRGERVAEKKGFPFSAQWSCPL